MNTGHMDAWLNALGYDNASPSLHRASGVLARRHPYAPELFDLLSPSGEIRAEAVYDVEGVPTISFFVDDGALLENEGRLTALRQRIWNQGLVSVLLVVTPDAAVPVPVNPRQQRGTPLALAHARKDGPFSSADIQSGHVRSRYSDWFRLEDRVDRKLLTNLRLTVEALADNKRMEGAPFSQKDAQYLVAQALFVSYLEHRGIVGETYRAKHGVKPFKDLVDRNDGAALDHLLRQLKDDFNGDFLEREEGVPYAWVALPDAGFRIIQDFLGATDIARSQPSFFPYNFRYIPVELLSGIYESFLGEDSKKELSAYYTPRHLANLVVTQALEGSADILEEKIYDGACGSGILLTTAFRRLLAEAEARNDGHRLDLSARIDLLRNHIFGSDLSDAACRVTAFSLYLSLLEHLEPSDIATLCDDSNVKLPTLRGTNLFTGPGLGDFFSKENPLAKRKDYTLFLSNPPWGEESVPSSADAWAHEEREATGYPRVLRQIAADFAWKASECLAPTGRLCLILPMTLLLKSTSQNFVASWLTRVVWHRLINFGDLKELLFDDGRFSCVVLLGSARRADERQQWIVPPSEKFEYWVPKADIGLAFGRLALHGVDRHVVQTQAIAHSNRELVTRMWGDDFDLALWARLRLRGTFGDLLQGKNRRWTHRKGVHKTDNSLDPNLTVSSKALWHLPFFRPAHLYDCPVALPSEADPFPTEEIPTLPQPITDALLKIFDGPRILAPDGPAPDRTIRASFVNGPGCFISSVGVIAGPPEDEDLLRFATIYLRSDLVRYFTVTQMYQLLSDRDRVSLRDIQGFPFYLPERHPNPGKAREIVKKIAEITRTLEKEDPLTRPQMWHAQRKEAERLLQTYFGLDDYAQTLISETLTSILPATRPYGLSKVFELAQARVSEPQADAYAHALRAELEGWRDACSGQGDFEVTAFLTNGERAGPFGVVRVTLRDGQTEARAHQDDEMVEKVIAGLRTANLFPLDLSDRIYFIPDAVIFGGKSVYLIKAQSERLWLRRQARRDAQRIVEVTTGRAAPAQAAA